MANEPEPGQRRTYDPWLELGRELRDDVNEIRGDVKAMRKEITEDQRQVWIAISVLQTKSMFVSSVAGLIAGSIVSVVLSLLLKRT